MNPFFFFGHVMDGCWKYRPFYRVRRPDAIGWGGMRGGYSSAEGALLLGRPDSVCLQVRWKLGPREAWADLDYWTTHRAASLLCSGYGVRGTWATYQEVL